MIDFIQGEKFKSVADFTFAPSEKHRNDYDGLQNTLDVCKLKGDEIIYTHTNYVKQLFILLDTYNKSKFVVVSHNSDVNVDRSFEIPPNVEHWFTQNVHIGDYRVESLPIGLENDMWFKLLRKKEKMISLLRTPKKYRNLVYLNHNVKTNPAQREEPYKLFKGKSWVTVKEGTNGYFFDHYLSDIYGHTFVICPEGNGIDTHRKWETLYMTNIPIEKRNLNNRFYDDLPICLVDDWEEVTEEYLNTWLKDHAEFMRKGRYNMEKLNFEYWKKKIHDRNYF
jgi:hypothetical protein